MDAIMFIVVGIVIGAGLQAKFNFVQKIGQLLKRK